MRWPRAAPVDGLRARREVERQLEWAEAYIAAAEGIELGDPHLSLELRRLRAAVRETLRNLDRPRVL